MCIAQSIDVFATGLVAGVFLMGSFAVHPAAARLDASSHFLFRQQLIHRLSKLMPPLMLLSVAACITVFIVCRTSVSWQINTLSGVLSLATMGITIAVNVPLNRRFARWSPSALPCDWERPVQRWNAAHCARTATAVAAFLCAIFAAS
jgi:uncharacterized membrane protein